MSEPLELPPESRRCLSDPASERDPDLLLDFDLENILTWEYLNRNLMYKTSKGFWVENQYKKCLNGVHSPCFDEQLETHALLVFLKVSYVLLYRSTICSI